MPDVSLSADDLASFTVPHALCLAGEWEYLLNGAMLVVATSARLHASVAADHGISISVGHGKDPDTEELARRWAMALKSMARQGHVELDGLAVHLGPAPPNAGQEACAALDRCWRHGAAHFLGSPAAAVAMACAARVRPGNPCGLASEPLAELAAAMLREVLGIPKRLGGCYYSECLACLEGGALHVAPATESLNVQLLLPPRALILALALDASRPEVQHITWEPRIKEALDRIGWQGPGAPASLGSATQELFELAAGRLDEREIGTLYGLLRVREMIEEHVERLGQQYLDHDLLAEICDEESAIMENYFGFPGASYAPVRETAVAAGALGGKLAYAFGDWPAMIILAPGRRDAVLQALERRFERFAFVPVDPAAGGPRSTEADQEAQ